MKITVGCPVYERAWILDLWFDRVFWHYNEEDLRFVFAYTPGSDDTLDIIRARTAGRPVEVINITQGDHSTERNWGMRSRIETLATCRNAILDYVRTTDTHVYLSLDSDILLPTGFDWSPDILPFDATGWLAYLGSGAITNGFVALRNGYRKRMQVYDAEQSVEVLCAVKFMSRRLFMDPDVKYGYNRLGEDFYWSDLARQRGYSLGIDSTKKCKHIMQPSQLDFVDQRIGW